MGAFVAGVSALAGRVVKLERPSLSQQRFGLLRMPPILALEPWEALAAATQQALAQASHATDEPQVRDKSSALDRPWWDKA